MKGCRCCPSTSLRYAQDERKYFGGRMIGEFKFAVGRVAVRQFDAVILRLRCATLRTNGHISGAGCAGYSSLWWAGSLSVGSTRSSFDFAALRSGRTGSLSRAGRTEDFLTWGELGVLRAQDEPGSSCAWNGRSHSILGAATFYQLTGRLAHAKVESARKAGSEV